jgi:hypothetical protein
MADRYTEAAKKVRERKSTKKTTNPAGNFDGGDDQLNGQLAGARQAVATQVKSYIIAGGIQDALQQIASGDFGSTGVEAFSLLNNSFTLPLEVEVQLMGENLGGGDQKNLLMPSAQSDI